MNQIRFTFFDLLKNWTLGHFWTFFHGKILRIALEHETICLVGKLFVGFKFLILSNLHPRSAEQKSKVAEFSVSKNGRLLQPYNCVLDSLSGNLALKTRDLCFLDGDDGDIKRIVVPIR